jgi:putative CocE/NonD family hydrolase
VKNAKQVAVAVALVTGLLPALGHPPAALAAGCPGVRAPSFSDVVVQRDLVLTMRDGIHLHANVVLPSNDGTTAAAGPFPVLLTQTPYNKNAPALNFETDGIVEHGYAQVIVDVRGTGASEGLWDSFGPLEQGDSAELVDWLTGASETLPQPAWANGTLGLHGTSYGAINQLLTAAQRPVVKSLFPIVPMADAYRDITGSGGQVNTSFIPSWLGLVTALGLLPPTDIAQNPAGSAAVLADHAVNVTKFQTAAVVSGTTGGDNAYDGPFYRTRSPIEIIDQVTAPTFIVGGWYDLFQRGEPLLFQHLQANGVPSHLLMGPWTHIGAGNGLPTANEPCTLEQLELRWHDHWLLGLGNDLSDIAPVTYEPIGDTDFATAPSWPPATPAFTTLFAQGDSKPGLPGQLATSAPGASEAPQVLLQQMPSGVCTKSTTQWTAGGGEGGFCDTDNEVNDLTGAVFDLGLPAGARVAGPIAAHLYLSTTATDAFLTARLEDVDPMGRAHQLSAGWNVLSLRALDDAKSEIVDGAYVRPYHPFTRESVLPVVAGSIYDVWVELFPVAADLAPGHSLRLAVQTSDAPHLSAPIPQTQALAGGVLSLYHDATHRSSVVVPFQP